MFGLPAVTCVLRVLCLLTCFNFDTPTYYIQKNKKPKAMAVLKRIYKKKFKRTYYEKLKKDCGGDDGEKFGLKDLFTSLKYPLFLGCTIGIS